MSVQENAQIVVLIDEALAILRQNQRSAQDEIQLRRDSFGAQNQLREKRVVLLKQPQKESIKNVYHASNEKHGTT